MTSLEEKVSSSVADLANYLNTDEPGLRLLISILLGYPVALMHRYTMYGKNPVCQHLYFISTGFAILFFNFGLDSLHSVVTLLVTHLFLVTLGGKLISVVLVFLFTMVYLLTGYYYTCTLGYDIIWTLPQCILTLRLIGLSFDVYDGKKPPNEELSVDQKKTALPNTPKLLETMGYAYFPAAHLVGPQFSIKRYLNLVAGLTRENSNALPNCVGVGILRGILGFIYLGVYTIGRLFLSRNFLLSDHFKHSPFWRKCMYLGIWGKISLSKYIGIWLLTEGACICSSVSYNGTAPDGTVLWDGCSNVKLLIYERANRLGDYILSFNITTNQWTAQYIYKRLKFLGSRYVSHILTLLFLAVWHGTHSGYYMCFLTEFLCVLFERHFEPLIQGNHNVMCFLQKPTVRPFVWVIMKVYNVVFLGYCLVPFILFAYSRWAPIYKSVYYFGHIFFMVWPIYYPVVKLLLTPNTPPPQLPRPPPQPSPLSPPDNLT